MLAARHRLSCSILLLVACEASRSVPILEVRGSGVKGDLLLTEGLTKSFDYRVDGWLEVDGMKPEMHAVMKTGRCATPGGGDPVRVGVHPRDTGGAADVLLPAGRLADVEGKWLVQVFAGEPDTSTLVACGDL